VSECLRAGHLDAVALAQAAECHGLGLAGGPAVLHCCEEALLWRCVCLCLSDDAAARGLAAANDAGAAAAVEAAAAGQRIDALERLLPATAQGMLALVSAHVDAQPPLFFSACCLMDVAAACVDYADGSARAAALNACAHLISRSAAQTCAAGWACLRACSAAVQ